MGDPIMDDSDNTILCHKHGFLVVSIPYLRAPTYQFPAPVHSCVAMIRAVLDDQSIRYDRSKKVAVLGFSAGGNLALTCTQLLKDRVGGAVSIYPVVDMLTQPEEKEARGRKAPGRKRDPLGWTIKPLDWAYIPAGQDLKDPLLSPRYAAREQLVDKVCVASCEFDLLCTEVEEMMEGLAVGESGTKKALEGGAKGWEKGGLRWENIEGVEHGFNLKKKNKEVVERFHEGIAGWLRREVFC